MRVVLPLKNNHDNVQSYNYFPLNCLILFFLLFSVRDKILSRSSFQSSFFAGSARKLRKMHWKHRKDRREPHLESWIIPRFQGKTSHVTRSKFSTLILLNNSILFFYSVDVYISLILHNILCFSFFSGLGIIRIKRLFK